MQSVWSDILFGARMLIRTPASTVWILLALAVGIGVNAAVYSVIDARLLHPVGYRDPESLVVIWDRDAQGVNRRAAAGNFRDWRAQLHSFQSIAGWAPASYVMTSSDRPQSIAGATVTANFFSTLDVQPALGRGFREGEDAIGQPNGAARVAVIGDAVWHAAFGASPSVIGQTIQLNRVPYEIIGVAPPDFEFYGRRAIFVPVASDAEDRSYHYLLGIGRLKHTRAQAQAELNLLARRLAEGYPVSNKGWSIQTQDLVDWVVDPAFKNRMLLILSAVGFVLLITCMNVAGLLITKTVGRRRELAVRGALGAGRPRLIRQLVLENFLLAILGAVIGLAVAWTLVRLATPLVAANVLPRGMPIRLNAAVVWFTAGLAIISGLAFGLLPALTGSRVPSSEAIKDGGRGVSGSRSSRSLRQAMVALQVAVALMLVASAALVTQSLANVARVDTGIALSGVYTTQIYLSGDQYDKERAVAYYREAVDRVSALRGVTSAAIGSNLPLYNLTMEVPFEMDDAPVVPEGERPGVGYTTVSPQYFSALGIPIKGGRAFSEADSASAVPVVIVNQAFVEQYCPTGNPVGRRILMNRPMLGQNGFEEAIRPEIVGVVGNVRLGRDAPDAKPIVYAPAAQNIWSEYASLVLQTNQKDPQEIVTGVRGVLAQMDGSRANANINSLEDAFRDQFSERRFQSMLFAGFAAMALVLASIGIYGVNAYTVAQRTNEIGIRLALGASPRTLVAELVRSGMRVAAFGIVGGLLGALAISSSLRSVLFGVSATDPVTLAAATLAIALVSLLACYFPARHALAIPPATALRKQ